jgi:hypothetical protein
MATSATQPVLVMGPPAPSNAHLQAGRYKVLESITEGAFKARRGVLGDNEQHTHGVELRVGGRRQGHLPEPEVGASRGWE